MRSHHSDGVGRIETHEYRVTITCFHTASDPKNIRYVENDETPLLEIVEAMKAHWWR
jgi:hypothetical protein